MSSVSYLISVLIPGEELQFVEATQGKGMTEEFNEASTWSNLEEAKGYRDVLMEEFKKQGYRTALAGEALGDPEDPASKVVMFTILRTTLEPFLTTHLVKY